MQAQAERVVLAPRHLSKPAKVLGAYEAFGKA